ncbi:outer membrane lipoprotein carrier protein LolA [Candidatus Aminicenantes bacterium AC-335-A11]|jgi:outer membrane lipoprotein-sorting protein|nr:outer membrane lipoprotein carrier protein LolA [SCandidatus Aminicenantes bacterium Aminicenantia_JdfR_composite]MCP2618446.1 outer membrane lipoprotein carrier protein LolA [Candidatus Aminicenantes bacterium AC-335-A11]
MRKKLFVFVFILFLFLYPLCFSKSAEEIINKFEEKFREIKSLSADFVQIYHSDALSTPLKEKGKLYFKNPSLMRWDYFEPERKIFIYSKGEFLLYVPEDKQVIKSSRFKEKFESEILSILTGQLKITENYKIDFFNSENKEKTYSLKLKPLKEREYTFILIELEKDKFYIKRAVFFDWAGSKQEFIFSNIKENISIPDKLFTLNLPPGVEIIIE